MKVVEVEGKSVEEATEAALERLGVSRDKVVIDILEEGAKGLFGLIGNRPARVKVSYSPTHGKAEEAKSHLQYLVTSMGVDVSRIDIEALEESGEWKLHVKSTDDTMLRFHNGEVLESLAFIISRLVNRSGDDVVRLAIDSNNFWEESELELQRYALECATRAQAEQHTVALRPMTSRERKIIHVALKDIEGIKTVSSGEGHRRRVIVVPEGADRRFRSRGSRDGESRGEYRPRRSQENDGE